jgi:hypothetical protein
MDHGGAELSHHQSLVVGSLRANSLRLLVVGLAYDGRGILGQVGEAGLRPRERRECHPFGNTSFFSRSKTE